jgi:hypothetical protein
MRLLNFRDPGEGLGRLAHPGRRLHHDEGENPTPHRRRVDVDTRTPDDATLAQLAHALMSGAGRKPDRRTQGGVRPGGVLLEQGEQFEIDVIHLLHGVTISCPVQALVN